MKLHKSLTIAGVEFKLVQDDLTLDLFTPGRAMFVVQHNAALSGVVLFDLGYQPNALTRYFIGYIESSVTVDAQQQKIFCRELAGTLRRDIHLGLRHVSLNEALLKLAEITALEFITPEQPYTEELAPYLYSTGNGYYCMDALGGVYGIERYIWQQQGDGKIFVGRWDDSFWSTHPVSLDQRYMTQHSAIGRAMYPALPNLRPGVYDPAIGYINTVRLNGNMMTLSWEADPWKNR